MQRTIDRSEIRYGPAEREELLAEGLTILYELAARYEPGIGGRDPANSTFAGYAAWALPKRLGDAWHRFHPEHRYITDPLTGARGWSYGRPMLSLDGLGMINSDRDAGAADGIDRHLLHARLIDKFCHATRAGTVCLSS